MGAAELTPIAFDTETALIAPGLLAPPLVCVSYPDRLLHHTEARADVQAMIEGDRVLVGHNVAFDWAVICAKWPDLLPAVFAKYARGQITDTMIREKLIDIASSGRKKSRYSLAALCEKHLDRTLEKDAFRLGYGKLHGVPLDQWEEGAKLYAIEDARTTLEVWRAQEARAEVLADQYRQTRGAWWLHLISCWGIKTDPVAVAELEAVLRDKYNELESGLIAAGLVRTNGTRDMKAAARRMLSAVKNPQLTGTGKPKIDRDSCEMSGDPVLIDYARISAIKKRLSTDVPLLQRGLIQTRFNTLLETGRTSSSPNIQNLPRSGGVRECFVPRPGCVFAAADYGAFELRTVAQAMIKIGIPSKLAEALNKGFDPHLEVARQVVGCTYEQAAERLAAGDEKIGNARQVGKVANFGFPGGLGLARFCDFARSGYGVTITEEEARNLKQKWITAWPEFRHYFEWVSTQCGTGKAKMKQVFVDRYRGGCSYTEACNTMFQGLAADAAKHAGFLVSRACYADPASPLYGARIVNFVHDELIVEVRDDETAADAAEELARLMVEGAAKFLPDVPPIAEPLLMRRWSKKAKPARDAGGRLIPC